MENISLCLLDCSAIQQYVFGSNKLKSNIGASYLVGAVYDELIPEALNILFSNDQSKYNLDAWQKTPGKILLKDNPALLMETGYIGGGNALLLFRANETLDLARQFITIWTTLLLSKAPGIVPAAACVECDIDDSEQGIENVFKMLAANKNTFIPETVIPGHGITAECNISGLSAEVKNPLKKGEWISAVSRTKLNYVRAANQILNDDYQTALQHKYEFADDIEKLGQSKTAENHVAIIHIDGNEMGEKFKKCPTLEGKRLLSIAVNQAVKRAMNTMLEKLINKMDVLKTEVLDPIPKDKNGPEKLPLRPIIVNGDDITFICDARLGFFLTETFMREFANAPLRLKFASGKIIKESVSSCAGMAIMRTKYPFYRGYMLAEALCSQAKEQWRKKKQANKTYNGSWIDFHIAFRGLSGSIKEIRAQNYQVGVNSLLWRPWEIGNGAGMHAFSEFKSIIKTLACPANKENRWPRSKLNRLAQALMQGEQKSEEFLETMRARDLTLPDIAQLGAAQSGWHLVEANIRKTPYYDILEAIEFYPECLLV